jgi:putative transposase
MSRISPKRGSLGSIIRSYKSAVTNWSHSHGGDGPLWEPRFYDHIIRNGKERNTIRAYIRNNPAKWGKDKDLPYDNPFSSSRTP